MSSLNEAYNGFIYSQKDLDEHKNKLKNMLQYRDMRNELNAQKVLGTTRNNYFYNEQILPVKKDIKCQRCNGDRIEINVDKFNKRFKCKFCGYISID